MGGRFPTPHLIAGEIGQLSPLSELRLQRLLFLSSSSDYVSRKPVLSSPSPVNPLSFAQVPSTLKATVTTASEVHRLCRLKSSLDIDVAAVLRQFRLVAGFNVKFVRPDNEE